MRISIRVFTLTALLTLSSLPLLSASVFDDQFDGTSLDLGKWTILDGSSGISVGNGVLTLSGGPDHKRLNTIPLFMPPAGGAVTASARIYIGVGDYQKFGFNVNAVEYPGPTAGFYLDTGETPNTITAIVWPVPGVPTVEQIPLPWGSWYELAVRWTESDVTFFVDGVAHAQFPFTWGAPLPVGVWNDRPPTMHVDWVRVDTSTFDSDGDAVPDSEDGCANSILSPTVMIGMCDSGAVNVVDADGCTLADKVNACFVVASNHGQFVSCVAHLTSDERIRRCAARSRRP